MNAEHIIGELTIQVAADQRVQLLAAVARHSDDLALDLSNISNCDSAGVQLLLATQRSVEQRGGQFGICAASDVVVQALKTYGLQYLHKPGASA